MRGGVLRRREGYEAYADDAHGSNPSSLCQKIYRPQGAVISGPPKTADRVFRRFWGKEEQRNERETAFQRKVVASDMKLATTRRWDFLAVASLPCVSVETAPPGCFSVDCSPHKRRQSPAHGSNPSSFIMPKNIPPARGGIFFGVGGGIRTHDIRNHNPTL